MRLRNSRGAILGIASIFLFTSVTLTGCVRLEVVDTQPTVGTSIPSASPPEHNLAILTVDFEPPLNYQQLILGPQSLSLVISIENTGSHTERNVTVRAELSTPEDPDMLLTQGASVASIDPGKVQVVRFSCLGEIPYHQNYHLEVVVEPVDGESDLIDNIRAFDIQIYLEQDGP